MSRPSTVPKLDERTLRLLYDRLQSARKVAKQLGVPRERVRLAMLEYGVAKDYEMQNNVKLVDLNYVKLRPELVDARDHGEVAQWLQKYPHRKLPRDAAAIADVMGVSANAVRTYFYRLRKKMIEKLENLPDISQLDLEMIGIDDAVYRTRQFKTYDYRVDYYSMFVTVHVILLDETLALFEIEDLLSFERVLADALLELSPEHRATLFLGHSGGPGQQQHQRVKRVLCTNRHAPRSRAP